MTTQLDSIPDIPTGYLTETVVSRLLNVTVATLRTWASRRQGPPRAVIGKRPIYRQSALEEWLLSKEVDFDAERRKSRRGRVAA